MKVHFSPMPIDYEKLFQFCRIGDVESLKYLLQFHKKNPSFKILHIQSYDGTPGIFLSAKNGHINLLKYLLEDYLQEDPKQIQELLLKTNQFGNNIFHYAIYNSSILSYLLLKLKENISNPIPLINQMNEDSVTPLHLCAHHGFYNSFVILLQQGASPSLNIYDFSNLTPLTSAITQNNLEIVQYIENFQKNQSNTNNLKSKL